MRSSQQAIQYLQQLSSLARGRTLPPPELNANVVLEKAVELLRTYLDDAIVLTLEAAADLDAIYADEDQIMQMIINLAFNARDAMPEGGTLKIQTTNAELTHEFCRDQPWARPGRFIRIQVADTGVGMTDEVKARIFEPFFTTKEAGQGTGLGLALVEGMIKRYEGFIHVWSEPGQGAIFNIYLPSFTPPAATAPPAPRAGSHELRDATILLLEAEAPLLELHRHIIHNAGFQLLAAHTIAKARTLFETHRHEIRLMILDMALLRREKEPFCDQIRDQCPDLPIVFLSDLGVDLSEAPIQSKNHVHLIAQPFRSDELVNLIQSCLREKSR
jgi:two-component system, cell cycle sensor histidine kinase and response regulator CckA